MLHFSLGQMQFIKHWQAHAESKDAAVPQFKNYCMEIFLLEFSKDVIRGQAIVISTLPPRQSWCSMYIKCFMEKQ